MNRFVDSERTAQEFSYDAYFDDLRRAGRIRAWSKTAEGDWRKIGGALSGGFRIRYAILEFLDVSLGVQAMKRTASGDLNLSYARDELSDVVDVESLEYAPLSVEIKAACPSVGIHVRKRFGRILEAEISAAGGPLFAQCSVASIKRYACSSKAPITPGTCSRTKARARKRVRERASPSISTGASAFPFFAVAMLSSKGGTPTRS